MIDFFLLRSEPNFFLAACKRKCDALEQTTEVIRNSAVECDRQ